LTQDITSGGTIYVTSTAGFTEPESGQTALAYINNLAHQEFSYYGLTATAFTGVTLTSGCSGVTGDTIQQAITSSNSIADPDGLLPKLGDRLYKKLEVDNDVLYDQTTLDRLTLSYLREFYKNHSKITVNVLYAPYLKLGQTVSLTDAYNSISGELYFIEAITTNPTGYKLTLGKYPA